MKLILIIILLSFTTFAQGINEKILFAAARGEIDKLNNYLLEDSIDINYKYENGYSALDYAIERGYKNTFSRLAEYYSTEYKNVLSIDSNSVKLFLSVLKNDSSKVEKLLSSGVDPNIKNISGYYPISVAVRWESLNIVKSLLKYGANVNLSNTSRYNTTPLMESSRNGNTKIGNMLISNGADVNAVDINNDPAINWATYFGQKDFVELLLKNGARTDLVGKDSGDNALEIAKRMKHPEIVKLLEKYKK